MLGPDISSAAVERDETGTAHFDDLKLHHILDERIDLLTVSGGFNAYGFIRKIDDLRAEDIRSLNDIGVLLFGVPDLDEKVLSFDTVFSREDNYFFYVIKLTELGYYLILIILLSSQRNRDPRILRRLSLTYCQRVDILTSSREHRGYT